MNSNMYCLVGASGNLEIYLVEHCLDRTDQVVGVCRFESESKPDVFRGQIEIGPGYCTDLQLILKALAGCEGVLTVVVPWGKQAYSSFPAQAEQTVDPRAFDWPVEYRNYLPLTEIALRDLRCS